MSSSGRFPSSTAEIVTDRTKLAEGVLMQVNGENILVKDIWSQIKDDITSAEVREAKQWLANMILLERALTEAGVWISDEEAERVYREHVDPYKDSIFSIERLAVSVSRFPSAMAYKDYYRAYESFRRKIADRMTEEALKKFEKERTRHLVGQVSVDADVILLSAYDFEKNEWKESGWQEAKAKVQEVLKALVEEGRPWEQVLNEYSEFHDPPVPVSQRNQAQKPEWVTDQGRFRNKQRNLLLKNLDESEYWLFLNGESITAHRYPATAMTPEAITQREAVMVAAASTAMPAKAPGSGSGRICTADTIPAARPAAQTSRSRSPVAVPIRACHGTAVSPASATAMSTIGIHTDGASSFSSASATPV